MKNYYLNWFLNLFLIVIVLTSLENCNFYFIKDKLFPQKTISLNHDISNIKELDSVSLFRFAIMSDN